MAFSYTIFYFTEIATMLIYCCGNILGRILWDGPPTLRHLVILILYKTSITSIIDLINWIVQVLKKDLERLAISIRDTGLMEPVKL